MGKSRPRRRAELCEPVSRPYFLALPAWSDPGSGHNNAANYRGGSGYVAFQAPRAARAQRGRRASPLASSEVAHAPHRTPLSARYTRVRHRTLPAARRSDGLPYFACHWRSPDLIVCPQRPGFSPG